MIGISNTIQHVMDKATAKEGLLVITLWNTPIDGTLEHRQGWFDEFGEAQFYSRSVATFYRQHSIPCEIHIINMSNKDFLESTYIALEAKG